MVENLLFASGVDIQPPPCTILQVPEKMLIPAVTTSSLENKIMRSIPKELNGNTSLNKILSDMLGFI